MIKHTCFRFAERACLACAALAEVGGHLFGIPHPEGAIQFMIIRLGSR